MIQPAARKMSNASTVPEIFSTLPCPKGWSSSAGLPDFLTAKNAMMAANRSTPEWMASDITETDPIIVPATSLRITRLVFEITESRATFDFRLFFSASLSSIFLSLTV